MMNANFQLRDRWKTISHCVRLLSLYAVHSTLSSALLFAVTHEQSGTRTDKKVAMLLRENKYQEAIWRLEETQKYEKAKQLREDLESTLTSVSESTLILANKALAGATKPKLFLLPNKVKAVFKRKSSHPSSNYKSEVAVYKIDKMFDFRVVPVTVRRKLFGHKGSFQYFVPNAKAAKDIPDFKKSAEINVLDYLISNKDRNGTNLLIRDHRPFAIDHGLSLRGLNLLGRILQLSDNVMSSFGMYPQPIRQEKVHPTTHIDQFRAANHILRKLNVITLKELKLNLSDLLCKSKIKLIFKKKEKLLNILESAGYFDRKNR